MTLNDIIVSALIQTGRGHDAQTMDTWRDKLTGFANDAIMDLALAIRPIRTEKAAIANGRIDCNALERECIRVMSIRQCGREADFYVDERSAGVVRVNADDGDECHGRAGAERSVPAAYSDLCCCAGAGVGRSEHAARRQHIFSAL